MIWSEPMFFGEGCHRGKRRLRRRISDRRPHPNVFLIVIPPDDHAVLEVIPSMLLIRKGYPTDGLTVIGVAATRREALCLVEKIISGSFRLRGDVDIRAYMRQLQSDGVVISG